MRKVLSRLYLIIIAVLSVSGCFIRLFQLLKYTDKNTGLVTSNNSISYVIYGVFVLNFAICVLYSAISDKEKNLCSLSENRCVYASAVICAFTYFYDFIHQCLNLYNYFNETEYIEYNYAVFAVILGITSLISCFYLFMCSRLLNGYNYDFRRLGILHFAPAVWAFSRLIIIMMKIVNFKEDTESFCELLFLIVFICFSFSFISAVDRQDKRASKLFTVSGLMTFFTSFLIAMPRVLAVMTGRHYLLYDVSFSSLTYLFIGILSLTMVVVASKKDFGVTE